MTNDHFGFIVAAFAIAAAVVCFMIGSIVLDHRSLRRALARFPERHPDGEA